MRLVLTSHLFLPDHGGGTEVLTLSSARELQRRGHDVVVCTGRPTEADLPDESRFDEYEHDGIHVHRYSCDARPDSARPDHVDPLYGRWFGGLLRRFSPDVVHFFHLGNLSASAIDACVEAGVPTVMTTTDYWLTCPNCQLRLPDDSACAGPDDDGVNCIRHAVADTQPGPLAAAFGLLPDGAVSFLVDRIESGAWGTGALGRKAGNLARRPGFLRERMNRLDRVIVPTRLMLDRLVACGLRADRAVLRRYGIRAVPPVPRVADERGRLRVGFIGTLGEHKGAHVAVAAVRSLPAGLPVELRIYGGPDFDPPYTRRLRALAGDDPRIRFCGTFPNDEIATIFSGIDVLVVPSIWFENTPLVIYSAQAAACPVVASDLGGMSEAVEHGRNGLLFPAGDAGVLARLLENLATDRAVLDRLSASAVPPKTDAEYVDEMLQVYAEVMAERRGGR